MYVMFSYSKFCCNRMIVACTTLGKENLTLFSYIYYIINENWNFSPLRVHVSFHFHEWSWDLTSIS